MYQPIRLNFRPGIEYHTQKRYWQGCPSILHTPHGRLFAAWYSGGTGEPDPDNYNLLVRSEDDGWTWSEPEVVVSSQPESGFLAIDIQLWLDPSNRMWMFITQRYLTKNMRITDPGHLAVWAAVCDNPDGETLEWSSPRFVSQGFLRTQPTVLSNGDWVLCAYDWSSANYRYSRSKDQGKTWIRCEAGEKTSGIKKKIPAFEETMIMERSDHSLLMFARDHAPLMVKCISSDLEGSSWSAGEYTGILTAGSRFFLRRLRSGRVLLIRNDAANRRANLCASLSEDDGDTWKYSLQLDDAVTSERSVSYPDAVQADDGRIFIIYDCGRKTAKEIRMAQITEEDIIQGAVCDDSSYLSRIISKAPGIPQNIEEFEQKSKAHEDWMRDVFNPLHGIMPEHTAGPATE